MTNENQSTVSESQKARRALEALGAQAERISRVGRRPKGLLINPQRIVQLPEEQRPPSRPHSHPSADQEYAAAPALRFVWRCPYCHTMASLARDGEFSIAHRCSECQGWARVVVSGPYREITVSKGAAPVA